MTPQSKHTTTTWSRFRLLSLEISRKGPQVCFKIYKNRHLSGTWCLAGGRSLDGNMLMWNQSKLSSSLVLIGFSTGVSHPLDSNKVTVVSLLPHPSSCRMIWTRPTLLSLTRKYLYFYLSLCRSMNMQNNLKVQTTLDTSKLEPNNETSDILWAGG